MSNIETFDEFMSTEFAEPVGTLPPFQFRKDKDDEGTLRWLTENFDQSRRAAQSRLNVYRRHHSLYKGVHWKSADPRDENRDNDDDHTNRKPRMTVNFVYEMTEAKVAHRSRSRTALALIPHNYEEQDDINNANACKLLLDARYDEIDFDEINRKGDRVNFLYGHSFFFVVWDPETGDFHPSWKKMMDKYKDGLPSEVKSRLKSAGHPVKVGDVAVELEGPDRVYPELGKTKWEEVDHVERIKWFHIDELKAKYPKHKEEIKENARSEYFLDVSDHENKRNYVAVREFFHRKTKWIEDGEYILYTDDVILERGPLPYEHGQLPCVPDTDIDVYSELWGRSFISNIEQMQRMYNNVQSSIARDYNIASAPKWIMPKGAAKISSLNNEFTIVEFSGPVPPKLVQSTPTSPQAMEVQDRLEGKISKHSTVYDISRGEVPTGITANAALRFLDEQESQMDQSGVSKRKSRIRKITRMVLATMGQNYTAEDGRTARTLGPNNEFLIKSIKKADFSKIYDVRLQNAPALPDTKSGKIAAIVDLNAMTQTDPIFRKEEVVQMLDLGLDEAFKTQATIAVTAARTAVNALMNGEPVAEPEKSDNLLVFYDIFLRSLQTTAYREKVKMETKKNFELYIKTIEGLMYDRARVNRKFLMELMNLNMYPVYFTLPMTLDAMLVKMQTEAQMVGQAITATMAGSLGGAPPANPPPPQIKPEADTGKVERIPEQTKLQGDT